MASFIGDIGRGLRCAIEPLQSAFSNEVALTQFFAEFGWDVGASPATLATIKAGFALDAIFDAAKAVADQIDSGSGDANTLGPALVQAAVKMVDAIRALTAAPPGGLPFPLDQPAFWNDFPPALADDLLLRLMQGRTPALFGAMRLLGVAEVSDETPAGPGRLPYRRRAIRWDRLPQVVEDPSKLIKSLYHWNDTAQPFDHAALMVALQDFFRAVRFRARQERLPASVAARSYDPTNPALEQVRQLAVPLFQSVSADGASLSEVGLALVPIPAAGNPAGVPEGLLIAPLVAGAVGAGSADPSPFALTLRGGFDLAGAFGAEIRPSGVTLFAAPGVATLDAELLFEAQPPTPWRLLGSPDGFRIEVGGFAAGVGLRGQLTDPEVRVRLGTGFGANPPKLAVIIQTSEADGFLGKLIGKNPIRLEFGGAVLLSTKTGFHFEGGGGISFAIPLHLDLGIAKIEVLTIGIAGTPGAVAVDAGITGKALLGPLTAVVEEFGLRTKLKFGGSDGRLGGVDVDVGFKPPKGVGLSIDAGVVKGGGYLFIDTEKGEYAGALELTFANFLSLKAIGLINTKMPGGEPGFSLLVIITAEFVPGFQLGFGFVLAGVGGLLGLNRAMLLEPLAQGVRTGAANNILFPTNVIENAPRIISDLRAIFPPFEGKFLIGPMAKIGWGTPTLISLSLGIIIEIPGNVVILGRLRVNLPTADAPLVLLQVTFMGAIEFDKRRIWFFASLFESRVLFITLDGEMGLLMDFSDNPNFVLSVGGFHPRYTAPALPFPSPRRISLNIINESYARIRVEGYFAVTSNSVQFGSATEMFFGLDGLSVEGNLTFDALIRFSPFSFIVEISAGFSVKVFGVGLFGVHLSGSLEGPARWRVRGSAEISLLFFSVSVDVDVTFGEDANDSLPPIPVMPLIRAELEKPENWVASLPPSGQLLTSLRKLGDAGGLVLHPVGTLRVSQRAVPLNLKIDKIGNQQVGDVNQLTLELSATGLQVAGPARESFARAHFQDMNDAQKLSQPAFEKLESGAEIGAGTSEWACGLGAERNVRYETIIVDTLFKQFRQRFFEFWPSLFAHFRRGSAISKSSLSLAAEQRLQPFAEKIELTGDRYVVAFSANNAAVSSGSAFGSYAEAEMSRSAAVSADPALADTLHVIPAMEVNRAA